jgi:hypothetical protein
MCEWAIYTEVYVCGATGHALLLAADVIVLVMVLVVGVLFVAAAEGRSAVGAVVGA